MNVANGLFFLALYMILNPLPLYVRQLGLGGKVSGMLVSLVLLAAFVVRPLVSRQVDRGLRVPVFLAGLGLMVLSALTFMVSPPWLLFLPSLIVGAGFGLATTAAAAMMVDVVPPARLGEGVGLFGTMITLAMTLGPVIGLSMAERGYFAQLFWLSVLLSLLSMTLTLVLARHLRLLPKRPAPPPAAHPAGLRTLVALEAWPAALTLALLTVVYGGLMAQLPLYGADRGIANVAPFFAIAALIFTIGRPLSGRLADGRGPAAVIIPGLGLAVVSMVLLAFSRNVVHLALVAPFWGVGFSFAQAPLQALFFVLAGPGRRGAASASYYMAFDLGTAGGAWLLGSVAAGFGYLGMFATGAVSAAAGLVFFIAWYTGARRRIDALTRPGPSAAGG